MGDLVACQRNVEKQSIFRGRYIRTGLVVSLIHYNIPMITAEPYTESGFTNGMEFYKTQ
jgi:hypothetical protein